MSNGFIGLSLIVALATFGCGSSDSDGGGGSGGTGATASGGAGSGGTGGSTSTGGMAGMNMGGMAGGNMGGMAGTSGSLLAPVIQMVMPMAPAGLHVSWMNKQSDCDSVEGERMSPTADWASVFSVPGYVDNKHDATATDKVQYMYRLRCKKGADYSPYSNEMGGMPQ